MNPKGKTKGNGREGGTNQATITGPHRRDIHSSPVLTSDGTWNRVGMAVVARDRRGGEGYAAFNTWSQKFERYDAAVTRTMAELKSRSTVWAPGNFWLANYYDPRWRDSLPSPLKLFQPADRRPLNSAGASGRRA